MADNIGLNDQNTINHIHIFNLPLQVQEQNSAKSFPIRSHGDSETFINLNQDLTKYVLDCIVVLKKLFVDSQTTGERTLQQVEEIRDIRDTINFILDTKKGTHARLTLCSQRIEDPWDRVRSSNRQHNDLELRKRDSKAQVQEIQVQVGKGKILEGFDCSRGQPKRADVDSKRDHNFDVDHMDQLFCGMDLKTGGVTNIDSDLHPRERPGLDSDNFGGLAAGVDDPNDPRSSQNDTDFVLNSLVELLHKIKLLLESDAFVIQNSQQSQETTNRRVSEIIFHVDALESSQGSTDHRLSSLREHNEALAHHVEHEISCLQQSQRNDTNALVQQLETGLRAIAEGCMSETERQWHNIATVRQDTQYECGQIRTEWQSAKEELHSHLVAEITQQRPKSSADLEVLTTLLERIFNDEAESVLSRAITRVDERCSENARGLKRNFDETFGKEDAIALTTRLDQFFTGKEESGLS
ncbi:MAG: hypothetical protein Q9225_006686 [Loekoesia sp. 1 TL-2023]